MHAVIGHWDNLTAARNIHQISYITSSARWCDMSVHLVVSARCGKHNNTLIITRSIWKMLGPFATASRRMHSPGFATGTVACRLRINVHDDNDNDNAWQRGPLWPHGMGPIRRRIRIILNCCYCFVTWAAFTVEFIGPIFDTQESCTDYYFICKLTVTGGDTSTLIDVAMTFDGQLDRNLQIKTATISALEVTFTADDFGEHFGQMVRSLCKLVG